MLRCELVAALTAVVVLSACAANTDPYLAEVAARPLTCKGAEDCSAKWSRAVAWVVQNSQWKIQTQTDQLIETFNPTDYSAAAGFTVNKVATGDGVYEIEFSTVCVNIIGCPPGPVEQKANFWQWVMQRN